MIAGLKILLKEVILYGADTVDSEFCTKLEPRDVSIDDAIVTMARDSVNTFFNKHLGLLTMMRFPCEIQ